MNRFLLTSLLALALLPAFLLADAQPTTLEGWGIQTFDSKDDLDQAIEISKQKARLDLSANILTTVKMRTVDTQTQRDGKIQEEYKSITVSKVGQVLRDVRMDEPKIDENKKTVTTRAWISKSDAQDIIQECLKNLRDQKARREFNRTQIQTITGGDQFYYKQRIVDMDSQNDLNVLNQQMASLREELIKEKLKDIQDVRNAVKMVYFKHFPQDEQITFLAYIDQDQYARIVKHYDEEVYKAFLNRDPNPYTVGKPDDPSKRPDIAESFLPVHEYKMLGFGDRFIYMSGKDPEFDINLYGRYFQAADHFGFDAAIGFSMGAGGNDLTNQDYLKAAGYTTSFDFHFPVEVNGYFYLSSVVSDQVIPFLRAGAMGAFSLASVQNPTTNTNYDLATAFSGGLQGAVGITLFQKGGIFLKTFDVGLECQWLPNGYYNEGGQLGIGVFSAFGL